LNPALAGSGFPEPFRLARIGKSRSPAQGRPDISAHTCRRAVTGYSRENAETEYVAYASEQNLLPDETGEPVRHPQLSEMFVRHPDGTYEFKGPARH